MAHRTQHYNQRAGKDQRSHDGNGRRQRVDSYGTYTGTVQIDYRRSIVPHSRDYALSDVPEAGSGQQGDTRLSNCERETEEIIPFPRWNRKFVDESMASSRGVVAWPPLFLSSATFLQHSSWKIIEAVSGTKLGTEKWTCPSRRYASSPYTNIRRSR